MIPKAHAHETLGARGFNFLRLVAYLLIAVTLVLYLLSLPLFVESLGVPCTRTDCSFPYLTTAQMAQLSATGIPIDTYRIYILSVRLGFVITFVIIAFLILLRKSDDGFALLVATGFILFSCTTFADDTGLLTRLYPVLTLPVSVLGYLGDILLLSFLYVFPNGRFVPRWVIVFVFIAAFFDFWQYLVPTSPLNPDNWNPLLSGIEFFGLIATGIYAQIYRYRRVFSPRERQQTKWVVFSSSLGLSGFIILILLVSIFPQLDSNLLVNIVFYLGITIFIALVPVSIAIAILRSHLWDIDILIRKTLTYTIVGALLLGVYFGSVILLQRLFAQVSNQRSGVTTVISTLAIAALFVPLRNKIQELIDRRFYRRKYDAQQILSDFAETVRDETDLEKLTGRLMQVVDDTMQPRTLSLWLVEDRRKNV